MGGLAGGSSSSTARTGRASQWASSRRREESHQVQHQKPQVNHSHSSRRLSRSRGLMGQDQAVRVPGAQRPSIAAGTHRGSLHHQIPAPLEGAVAANPRDNGTSAISASATRGEQDGSEGRCVHGISNLQILRRQLQRKLQFQQQQEQLAVQPPQPAILPRRAAGRRRRTEGHSGRAAGGREAITPTAAAAAAQSSSPHPIAVRFKKIIVESGKKTDPHAEPVFD